jgi:hypothetical protein
MDEENNDKKMKDAEKKNSSGSQQTPIDMPSGFKGEVNEKIFYREVIKSCWTHEPWLYFKIIVKSNEEMGDYIALHGLVPQNELPVHLRYKIPENEIWIRKNVYEDVERRRSILAHEYAELDLMISHAMSYKEAHEHAEFFEHLFYHE